ncbi:uncharacterized protein LOC141852748 isoform X2 [Brevipalpus obovatus]
MIFMPTECISIKTGLQVDCNIRPPERANPLCLFSVSAIGNKTWIFCGESVDDMRAWQLALEQARLLIVRSPFTSNGQYQHHHTMMPNNSGDHHHHRHGIGLQSSNSHQSQINSFSRPPNSYPGLDLPTSFAPPATRDGSLSSYLLSSSFRTPTGHDFTSISPSNSIPTFFPGLSLDATSPCSLNYPGYGSTAHQHLSNSGMQSRYSFVPNTLINPYLRPDPIRDVNPGSTSGSNPNPAQPNPLLWSPFIWW